MKRRMKTEAQDNDEDLDALRLPVKNVITKFAKV